MTYKNRLNTPLSFDIAGKHYDVGIGGTCEIPEKFAYVVAHNGLPLDPADGTTKASAHAAPNPRETPTLREPVDAKHAVFPKKMDEAAPVLAENEEDAGRRKTVKR